MQITGIILPSVCMSAWKMSMVMCQRRIRVDEMAGRDSGGEGQNPKYVALLAGFAMLYMQQSSRDSKDPSGTYWMRHSPRWIKERSEVCLRYARELDLQLNCMRAG